MVLRLLGLEGLLALMRYADQAPEPMSAPTEASAEAAANDNRKRK